MFFSVFIYLRVDDFSEDFVDKLMFYLFSLSLFLFINGPSYFLIYLLSKTFLKVDSLTQSTSVDFAIKERRVSSETSDFLTKAVLK